MLKLKLQYFGHLIQRADSLEKIVILGKTEGKRRSGWQRMKWLDNITDSMDMSLNKLWEIGEGQGGMACRSPWDCRESNMTQQLNNIRDFFQGLGLCSCGAWQVQNPLGREQIGNCSQN